MNAPNQRRLAVGALLATIGVIAGWFLLRGGSQGGSTSEAQADERVAPARPGSVSSTGPLTETGRMEDERLSSATAGDRAWKELLERLDALASTRSPAEARSELERLRGLLRGLPADEAVGLIDRYLSGGRDADLPLEFTIDADGFLASPPSLRVALLDELGRLDPAAAARIGREVLASPTAADEWAVALRNVARGENSPATADYLRGKTEELIRNDEWQARPSIGYLNAFDVLVHLGATESLPLLSELMQREERRDLAHASFLTLDRLTQRQPLQTLEQLAGDAALQAARPEMVAQQFARADLRDPGQRQLVRKWLTDPGRSELEFRAFAGVFPNNNRMISRNLLTDDQPPSGAELREHDLAVAAIVAEWQEDPALETIRPHLETIAGRLRSFTSSAPDPLPETGP